MLLGACSLFENGQERVASTPPVAPDLPLDPCVARAAAAAWVIPSRPVNPTASRSAADAAARAYQNAEWAKAERHFQDALRLDGRSGLIHLGLADVLARTGADEEARRKHLATAIVRLPTNPRAHEAFAYSLETDGDRRGALVHLRCAIALAPERKEPRRRAARLALDLEGEALATAIVRPLFDRPEAEDWLVMADLLAAAKNWGKAGEAWSEAARISASPALYRRAAEAFALAGRAERAEEARAAADSLDPPDRRRLRPLKNSRR